MFPGLLVRIHRINDSVEVLENSNMTFPFKGPWIAGKDVLITVDPANIQHIMSSNFSNYIKGAEFQEIFEVFREGIINSDAERVTKLKKFYRHLTPRFFWKLQNWIGFGPEKKMVVADAIIDRVCTKYILAKREEIQQGISHHEYVLTFFIKLDPIDDKFLGDVILGFIVAGRDTMASALSWFFWLLSENPQVTTRIWEEINKNLPRAGCDQENLDKLVYLHGALYEAMRLYPPTPFQRKASIKPDVLPSGHKVDENSPVMIFLYAMGRMRAIWGNDALEFKPERWVSETGGLRHEPSYKFFSFNAGPRTCLGKHTAMTHLKIIVVEILQNYDIEVVKGHKVEPLPGLTLLMKHGLKVTLNKRHSDAGK